MELRRTQVSMLVFLAITSLMASQVVFAEKYSGSMSPHERKLAEMQDLRASLVRRNLPALVSPPPTPPQVYNITFSNQKDHIVYVWLSLFSNQKDHISIFFWFNIR